MLDHGVAEGEIEDEERQIIERVFAFNDLKIRDVMTPKGKLFALDGALTVSDALQLVVEQPYSRIPIYATNPDDIVSVIYLRDLLNAVAEGKNESCLETIAHKALFVSQYQSLDELFETFRRRNRHFAIVVDEYGDVRGVATLEDLLEEIVGEIYDESDLSVSPLDQFADDEIVVDGSTELRVVSTHFNIDLPGKPTDTVSLWILQKLKVIPATGEKVVLDGLDVSIREASSRRIGTVHIRRLPKRVDSSRLANDMPGTKD
jgi:CBS domain containing-hemolysin-like protein